MKLVEVTHSFHCDQTNVFFLIQFVKNDWLRLMESPDGRV